MLELSTDETNAILNISPLAAGLYVLIRILISANPAAINWPTLANHCRVSIMKIRRLADQLQRSNLIKIASTSNKLVIELVTGGDRQTDSQTDRQQTALEPPIARVSEDALQKSDSQTDNKTDSYHTALYNVPERAGAENIINISPLEGLNINNNYSGSNVFVHNTITTTTAREEFSDDYAPNWQRWEEFLSREYQIQLHQLKHPNTIQMLLDWANRGVTIGDAKTGIAHAKAVLASRGQNMPAYPSYYRRFVISAQHTRLQEKERPQHENIEPAFNPRRETVNEKFRKFLYGNNTTAGTVYDATFVAS